MGKLIQEHPPPPRNKGPMFRQFSVGSPSQLFGTIPQSWGRGSKSAAGGIPRFYLYVLQFGRRYAAFRFRRQTISASIHDPGWVLGCFGTGSEEGAIPPQTDVTEATAPSPAVVEVGRNDGDRPQLFLVKEEGRLGRISLVLNFVLPMLNFVAWAPGLVGSDEPH